MSRGGDRLERKRAKALAPPTLRHRLEYVLVLGFSALARLGPVAWGYWLARRIGWLLHLLDGPHRRVARDNLRTHLRDRGGEPLSEKEVRRLARASFDHMVMVAVEMARLPGELERHGFEALLEVSGAEHVREALARGKGAIVVSAHLGNWEVFGATAQFLGLELTTVYRPLDNPLLDRWLRRRRGGWGQATLPKHGVVRGLLRALRDGRLVVLLVDQNAGRQGVFAPFFQARASTIPTPAELALRTGAAIIPGFSVRTGPGFRFRNWFEPPVQVEGTGDRRADVLSITAEVNRRVESAVMQAPGQWLWAHRRWKRKPPEETTE